MSRGPTEHDPLNGCILNFSIAGPMTGETLADFITWIIMCLFWIIIVLIIISAGASPILICSSSGRHRSSAFG